MQLLYALQQWPEELTEKAAEVLLLAIREELKTLGIPKFQS